MRLLTLFLIIANSLLGTNWYHTPFAPWDDVEEIGITELDALRESKFVWGVKEIVNGEPCRVAYFPIEGGHLRLHSFFMRDDDWYIYLSVGHKDKGFCEPLRFTEFSAIGPLEVYEAYLNDDNTKDIILVKYTGGNGSGGRDAEVGFLLSSPDKGGFTFQATFTILPEQDDFAVINDTKCFIQCDLKGVERCEDDKPHNFFVYHLMTFDGDSLKVNNAISEDFPKTIWWSFRPRHEETNLLSPQAKAKIVSESKPPIDFRGMLLW
jgi:hypothetical protein